MLIASLSDCKYFPSYYLRDLSEQVTLFSILSTHIFICYFSGIIKRFFATKGQYFSYWSNETEYIKGLEPQGVYNTQEMKSITSSEKRLMYIQFNSVKFKLELKALTDESCNQWVELLKCKKELYSVNELLLELDSGVTFQTEAFASLMRLKEDEQVNIMVMQHLTTRFS